MRVAIITPAFVDFNPGYSLTGIVADQCRMLQRWGHDVEVWVGEKFNSSEPEFPIKKIIPMSAHPGWIDYHTIKDYEEVNNQDEMSVIHPDSGDVIAPADHKEVVARFSQVLLDNLRDIDIVFTHDLIFTGWNLPLYLGIEDIAYQDEIQHVHWWHWVHSLPNHRYDWWYFERLGRFHRIIYPNKPDAVFCWENFHTKKHYVKTIPHIKDIRLVNRFVPETLEFIDKHPHVMNADVVQIYPAGTDRLSPKRVKELIYIFKYLKEHDVSVCLVCANQWATGRQRKEDVAEYEEIAFENGLTREEFIFTSEFKPEYETGIPADMLMDLFKLSNLFVFPTWSESFGLVLPEAILSGCVLPVLNYDLPQLAEMVGGRGLNFKFGSIRTNLDHEDVIAESNYYHAIASTILQTMCDDETIAARTVIRQNLNMDAIYKRYYEPLMNDLSW